MCDSDVRTAEESKSRTALEKAVKLFRQYDDLRYVGYGERNEIEAINCEVLKALYIARQYDLPAKDSLQRACRCLEYWLDDEMESAVLLSAWGLLEQAQGLSA